MKYALTAIMVFILSATTYSQFGSIPTYNYNPINSTMWNLPGVGPTFSKDSVILGDPIKLVGKKIYVTLLFDSIVVEDYGTEQKFVQDMTDHFEKKGAGRGKIWSDRWYLNKNIKFKELLIDKFNKLDKESETIAQPDSIGADYHLIVTTSYLNIGANWGIGKDPALIDARCDFQDRSGRSIVVVLFRGVPGRTPGTGDYDIPTRVAQCYQKLGKDLYGMIDKRFDE
jgi:hypothetical protein